MNILIVCNHFYPHNRIAALALIIYMLVRPYKEATKLTTNVKVSK